MISNESLCQQKIFIEENTEQSLLKKIKMTKTDSGIIITHVIRTNCKNFQVQSYFIPIEDSQVTNMKPTAVIQKKIKLIVIHGNISYDFFYRSKLDAPVFQQDFQQHTEKIFLNALIKEKYPLKIGFVLRQSNAAYFQNLSDINIQFDKIEYQKNLKQDILEKLSNKINKDQEIKKLENIISEKEAALSKANNWLNNPGTLQKMIEEREVNYLKSLEPKIDKTKITDELNDVENIEGQFAGNRNRFNVIQIRKKELDTVLAPYSDLYTHQKNQVDTEKIQLENLRKNLDSIKFTVKQNLNKAKQKTYAATSEKEILKIANEYGVNEGLKDKWGSKLASIKFLSIGKSIVNYTELTAQNITISGINIEYNPSYYAAFVAGKINYRFRDFFNKDNFKNDQYLVMGRFGIGDKDRKALIFSLFQGRKNTTQFGMIDSISNMHADILGYSIEAIYKIDGNTSYSAEFAKSTMPVTGTNQINQQLKTLWKFSELKNMGINIKAQTLIKETNTRLSGFFRKTGEAYQSFSLFSYHTDQTAWLIRADQPILHNKLVFSGMLRQNDFTNPFTDKTFKSSTIFKSLLISIRFPKYPFFNFGYYPATQFYFINKEKIRENAYYILNANMVYSYYFKGFSMNSNLLYNQFFNQATDTGFISYRGVNYYASQTIILKNIQLKAGFAYTKQSALKFYTMESSVDYSLKNNLKLGAGLKYNKIPKGGSYLGERILLTIDFNQRGGLQFQYEKTFLPTYNNKLMPLDIGRVSFYKIF
jgi:hypothetical protein